MSYTEWNVNKFLARDIPCKRDCERRTPGCHSSCQTYISWKEEKEKKRQQELKEQAYASEVIEQIKRFHRQYRKRNPK